MKRKAFVWITVLGMLLVGLVATPAPANGESRRETATPRT